MKKQTVWAPESWPEAQRGAGHQHGWRARELHHGRDRLVWGELTSVSDLWGWDRWAYVRTFSEALTHAIMHLWKLTRKHVSIYVTGKTCQQESFLLEKFFVSYIISQFELQSEIRVMIPGQETPVQWRGRSFNVQKKGKFVTETDETSDETYPKGQSTFTE